MLSSSYSVPRLLVATLSLALLGCTESGQDAESDGEGPSADAETGAGAGGEEGGSGESGDDDGNVFITPEDNGPTAIQCDVWTQDCPQGEKCMPWSMDPELPWNATKCSPVDGNPKQAGAECEVTDNRKSGVDDCDLGLMCWGVSDEGRGTCTEFCSGNEVEPSCNNPAAECVIQNDGVITLCLDVCDPLLQDCIDGQACYLVNDRFNCAPDRSGEGGAQGEPCTYINSCDPGLLCAGGQAVPGCDEGTGCCTGFCDTASAACPQPAMCTPLYEEGMAPPGFETLGACLIPEA